MWRWIRAAICILMASYAGGLTASYVLLIATDRALQSPDLRVYPFHFALGIMIFTVPGAGLVAAVYNFNKEKGRVAYATATAIGTVVGGIVLSVLSPNTTTFLIGAFYGFATATCWSLLHISSAKLYRRPSTHAKGL